MKLKIIIIFFAIIFLSFIGKENFIFIYPDYFPKPEYNFSANPPDTLKIEIGRALFYDPLLSKNNSVSCASCHSPYNAFSHTDHKVSHGIYDSLGTRNAPPLFNLAWRNSFMWDGAINHLDMQALAPISHPKEMGETISNVVSKLNDSPLYRKFFKAAYGEEKITGEKVLKCLSQFELTLISAGSKYDLVKQNKDRFTEQEGNGYRLFKKNCNSCHAEPLFMKNDFANNGLSVDTFFNDYGKMMNTHNSSDSLLFRIPGLRNLSYTFPYMHDGRFKTLREVLNHYTDGITDSPTLSQSLKHPIRLSENEKTDIIAFLLTLNDKDFIFSDKHNFPTELLISKK